VGSKLFCDATQIVYEPRSRAADGFVPFLQAPFTHSSRLSQKKNQLRLAQ